MRPVLGGPHRQWQGRGWLNAPPTVDPLGRTPHDAHERRATSSTASVVPTEHGLRLEPPPRGFRFRPTRPTVHPVSRGGRVWRHSCTRGASLSPGVDLWCGRGFRVEGAEPRPMQIVRIAAPQR